jgi:cytochrome c oxidase subunit 1
LNYLNNGFTLKSWLLTKDHKRIAIMYLITVSLFFMAGGLYASAIRLELLTPASDLLQTGTYNKVFTQHGILMIFFFLIPSIPAVLGNFILPIMIGAKDLALPRINLLSLYIYWVGGAFTVWALLQGGIDTGWTFYTPYSTTFSNTYVMAVGLGIFINGFSSILTGLNFIVTVHTMRAPGMTWFRLPLFVWAQYATSLVMILGTPVIAITVLLLAIERFAHVGIFDPAIGGDPILFQHMFWFYSHPAVYIMILPGMGVISELISNFSRKRSSATSSLHSRRSRSRSSASWFGATTCSSAASRFMQASCSRSLRWSLPYRRRSRCLTGPRRCTKAQYPMTLRCSMGIGFMGLFLIGGLTGLFLGAIGLTVHLTDTYFVVAHFHYVMVGGQVIAYLGGIHYWWPKMTGKNVFRILGQDLGDACVRRV